MPGTPALSLAEWVVLAVVSEQPTHGFPITHLTSSDGYLGRIWHIPRPVVYRSLTRLAEAGLITEESSEPGRGPQRTIYAVNAAGKEAIDAWLQTPVDHVREVRSHLLMKLALLHRAGADPADLLRRQREVLTPIAQAIAAERPDPADFESTLLAWRRSTAAAAITFLADVTPGG